MKPKVLILLDTHVVSGPANGLFQFFRHADLNRFDYLLGTFAYHNAERKNFFDAVVSRNLRYRAIPQHTRLDPRPLFETIRIIREEHITIVQSHGYKSHFIAAIAKLFTGVRWIAFSHGWTSESWKVKSYHMLDRFILRYPDLNVTVAPDMYEIIKRVSGRPNDVELVLNAIEAFDPLSKDDRVRLRKEFNVADDTVLIGCFARMSTEKGQRFLLDALKQLTTEKRSELLLVGEGVDHAALVAKTAALGLQDRVHFAGYQANIGPYYAAIDCLVLPSLAEGTPNVLLEAMSHGVPVVSTDVGAVREAITNDENGLLVKAGDSQALAAALTRMIDDENMRSRFIVAAKKSLYPKFDPSARAARIVSFYDRFSS